MRRGQVTAFIILGIVVLFILALAMSLISKVKQPPQRVPVEPDDAAERACLHQAALVALEEHGASSGVAALGTAVIGNTPVNRGIAFSGAYTNGRYGYISLPKLCLRAGPNAVNASRDNSISCMAGTYQVFEADSATMQYTLARSIEQHVAACGRVSSVTVTFGDDDVVVQAGNYTDRVPVRFKRMYNLAFQIAASDTLDPRYDKRAPLSIPGCPEPSSGGDCLLPGMSVTSSVQGGWHVVDIIDSERKVHGDPFRFRYVTDNRPPVVYADTIPDTIRIEPVDNFAPLVLDIYAVDPDEDFVRPACTSSDPVLHAVTCTSTDDPASIINKTTVNLIPAFVFPCTPWTFTVSATDPYGLVGSKTYTIAPDAALSADPACQPPPTP